MKNGVLKTDHKTLHLDILTSVSQAVVFIVHFSASFFFPNPFILSRLVWGHEQAESSHCRQSESLISS